MRDKGRRRGGMPRKVLRDRLESLGAAATRLVIENMRLQAENDELRRELRRQEREQVDGR